MKKRCAQFWHIKITVFTILLATLFLVILLPATLLAQVPVINYSSPHIFKLNSAISTLSPVNTGGAVPAQAYGQVVTIAGNGQIPGSYADGTGAAAGFNFPNKIATDAGGNIYVADAGNNRIRKVTPAGVVTTFAGSGAAASANGTGINASFNSPSGIATDASGNIYVAEAIGNCIRKITPNGVVTTLAGTGATGAANGSGAVATFFDPQGLAVDGAGNIYVADSQNNLIRKITPQGVVSTLAGTTTGGNADGSGTAAGFNIPAGIAVDASGNIYVADSQNNKIRKITATGIVTTVAGNFQGSTNGPADLASFYNPSDVTLDAIGNIYVADNDNFQIRKISPAGIVSTLAGSIHGGGDGIGINVFFNSPIGVTVDHSGNLYSSESQGNLIRRVSLVGNNIVPNLPQGFSFNYTNGNITGTPTAVAPQADYVVTACNSAGSGTATITIGVMQLTPLPAVTAPPSISYSAPAAYMVNNSISPLTPADSGGAVPTAAVTVATGFSDVGALVTDSAGNIYVTEFTTHSIKKISADHSSALTISTGTTQRISLAVDAPGNMYVAEIGSPVIKKIPAGGGVAVNLGSGFVDPIGIALDVAGNIYVADYGDHSIKKIPAGGGAVTVLQSAFAYITSIGTDAAGNVYVADLQNSSISKIPAGSSNLVTLASGLQVNMGYMIVDKAGNVYFGGAYNRGAIIKISAGSNVISNFNPGVIQAGSMTEDAAGNIYIDDISANVVKEVYAGGYNISPQLSGGLSFDSNTGTISGTPTVPHALTNYKIMATNSKGSSSATLGIAVNLPSIPQINYANPQVYTAFVAIAPLAPANAGGAVTVHTAVPLLSSINGPKGIAVDGAGNIYVANDYVSRLVKYPTGGGAPVTVLTNIGMYPSIAADSVGNVYVGCPADDGGTLMKVPASGGTPVNILTTTANPYGVTVDRAGNVYYCEPSVGSVSKIPAGGGTPVVLAANIGVPAQLAADAAGNVYVVDESGSRNGIKEILAGSNTVVNIASNLYSAGAIAVDKKGSVYVISNGQLQKFSSNGGTPITLTTGLNYPSALAVDLTGNIYIADNYDNTMNIIYAGGYSVNPALPAGLSIDVSTGIISGTPTAVSPATTYTVTASNGNSASFSLNITVKPYPPPVISYAGPQVYSVADAIAPLVPTSSGVTAINTPPPATLMSNTNASGVAVDVKGNVFVTDFYQNIVTMLPANGGTPVVYSSGFNGPGAVAVDTMSNVYVSNIYSGAIKKINTKTGTITTILNGVGSYGLGVDAVGNVYVSDFDSGSIKKIVAATGAVVTLSSGFLEPKSLAVDAIGNVFYWDNYTSTIKEIRVTDGSTITYASVDGYPNAIALDAAGYLYYTNQAYQIKKIPPGGGTPINVSAGFYDPAGLAIDGNNNIYIADAASAAIEKITHTGSYLISPTLPAGLAFNNVTGTISGAPAVATPAINYTVTAYNVGSNSSATVNIKVVDATLANLTISGLVLTPAFTPTRTNYTASVSNINATVKFIPTLDDSNATVKVNGLTTPSGLPSAPIPLKVGPNTVNVVVTAQDGTTTKTYTVVVTRLSNNANLSNLNISTGTLSPTFISSTAAYTASVTNATTSINLTPTTADANATVQVNGVTVASGTASANIPLGQGANSIHAVVHAQDGTQKTYTVTVTRLPNNANLAGLIVSTGTLSPVFASATVSYSESLTNATTSITLTPTTSDTKATVTVNGVAATSGIASASIPLNGGVNTIYIVVLAQDGTRKTYTLTITKPLSSNANLSNLAISSGTLAPVFVSSTVGYTATVSAATTSIQLTPTTSDVNATVKVNSINVKSGTASGNVPLGIGVNSVHAVVHAQDGTQRTYTVTVTRLSNNANMASLTVSSGRLSPAFVPSTTSYLDTVNNATTSIQITPTTSDTRATVTVNGTAVISGSASAAIPLVVGNNIIYEVVLAQDGTRKTYTTTVRRLTPGGLNSLYLPGNGEQTPLISSLNEKVEANNILSPNGDGINDIWVVKNIAFYPDNMVTVYNRAGEVVFTRKGYTNDWDGTYCGSALSEGTYYYSVDLGNGKSLKGFITVVSH